MYVCLTVCVRVYGFVYFPSFFIKSSSSCPLKTLEESEIEKKLLNAALSFPAPFCPKNLKLPGGVFLET